MKQVIHIHPEAPRKPPLGAACNGCGVCCLAEPCPVGVLVSRRFTGACKALVWSDEAGRYHCGLLVDEQDDAGDGARDGWSSAQGPLRRAFRPLWRRWVRRMISAGSGCDASIEVESAPRHEK